MIGYDKLQKTIFLPVRYRSPNTERLPPNSVVTLPQHILFSTDCMAFWKIECLANGMFCVSEALAGHHALASRVEPEVWGVLP